MIILRIFFFHKKDKLWVFITGANGGLEELLIRRTDKVHFDDNYAPNFEKVGSILVSACWYLYMYVWGIEIPS